MENTQSNCLMTRPDLIILSQILPRLSKGISNVGFNPLTLPSEVHAGYKAFHALKRTTGGKYIPLLIHFRKLQIEELHIGTRVVDRYGYLKAARALG